jgi:N-acetylglucosaminyldiphosphoundecaprenol N-acetyl-beta-D-mannosaminyltransferase
VGSIELSPTNELVPPLGRHPGSAPEAASLVRAHVLGCQIDRVDLDQAIAYCERSIDSRRFVQHMAINAAKLVAMRKDQYLREVADRCELVTADGQAVVWASKLLRDPLPSRVAGIDLMYALLSRAATKGYRVYVLGARSAVLERAVERIHTGFPGINIVGYRDGYYQDAEESEVAAAVAAAHPDVLLVAMTSPRKEYFLARHGMSMGVPFVMGVGGAIDVVAGVTKRAPLAIQRLGLEWLFRLAQEPRRLFRRYLSTNVRFILLVVWELAATRLRPRLS